MEIINLRGLRGILSKDVLYIVIKVTQHSSKCSTRPSVSWLHLRKSIYLSKLELSSMYLLTRALLCFLDLSCQAHSEKVSMNKLVKHILRNKLRTLRKKRKIKASMKHSQQKT